MNIEGIALNGSHLSNGRVQRATPVFARPSIDLDGTSVRVRRDWRAVPARDLAVGDVVPGVGALTAVHENITVPEVDGVRTAAEIAGAAAWIVIVHGGDGNTVVYDGFANVYAFTAV